MSNHNKVIALYNNGKPANFSPEQWAAWCAGLERYLQGPQNEENAAVLILGHPDIEDMDVGKFFPFYYFF